MQQSRIKQCIAGGATQHIFQSVSKLDFVEFILSTNSTQERKQSGGTT